MKYKSKSDTGFMVGFIGAMLTIILLAVGYVMNIIAIFQAGALSEWGGFEVLRVIGVFISFIGGVVGYF
jgi:hypothetical protein